MQSCFFIATNTFATKRNFFATIVRKNKKSIIARHRKTSNNKSIYKISISVCTHLYRSDANTRTRISFVTCLTRRDFSNKNEKLNQKTQKFVHKKLRIMY